MFSEVYWHHAVRSATAMFQRAIFMLHQELDLEPVLVPLTDVRLVDTLRHLSRQNPTTVFALLDGIFGPTRRLYKRLATYSYFEEPEIYRRLARRPYTELVAIAERIAAELSGALGAAVSSHEVLVDAPPAELEVDFDIEVFYPKERVYRRLGDVSPVVRTLAKEQFDDYVKRVRIFVHPRIAAEAARLPDLAKRLAATIEEGSAST
jgi:HD superfamily phosphohydrolase